MNDRSKSKSFQAPVDMATKIISLEYKIIKACELLINIDDSNDITPDQSMEVKRFLADPIIMEVVGQGEIQ